MYLGRATMDWVTYDSARRAEVEVVLWHGFDWLLQSRDTWGENEWGIV
jgi:hypothetical protein